MAKYQVPTSTLKSVVSICKGIIPKKPALPILECVSLKTEKGILQIGCTDLEVYYLAEIDGGNKAQSGKVRGCPKLKTLAEVVKTLDRGEEKVAFFTSKNDDDESNEMKLVGEGEFDIYGQSFSEMPTMQNVYTEKKDKYKKTMTFTMETAAFLDVHRRVVPFAARTSLRPVLSSVCFLERDGELRAVATDSYRLSERTFTKEELSTKSKMLPILIPLNAFDAVEHTLRSLGKPESIEMMVGCVEGHDKKSQRPEQITFKIQPRESVTVYVTVRCIDGHYPDYAQIIPAVSGKEKKLISRFEHDTTELLRVVKKAHVFAKEMNNSVVLTLSKGNLHLDTAKCSLGKFSHVIELQSRKKDDQNICSLSTVYMQDILNVLTSNSVSVEFRGTHHPAIFTEVGEGRDVYFHLVMPQRLSDTDNMPLHVREALSYLSSLTNERSND